MRNPKWHRDEIILALDLYFDLARSNKNAMNAQLQELSSLLNDLPLNRRKKANEKFRNANGVNMKLANFKFIDPEYSGEGLKGGSVLDKEIFFEFNKNLSGLKLTANNIKYISKYINENDLNIDVESYENMDVYSEGSLVYKWHKFRERNSTIVNKLKAISLKEKGKLACEVCGFDFGLTYGKLGHGFIEAHHKIPLALLKAERQVRMEDFALLCSNCHRMVHRQFNSISIENLTKLLLKNKKK